MMAKRTDENHKNIIKTFRHLGCSVLDLTQGRHQEGCPDLLVGCIGTDCLVEVKQRGKTPSASQIEFFDAWRGRRPEVVHDMVEVVELVSTWRN